MNTGPTSNFVLNWEKRRRRLLTCCLRYTAILACLGQESFEWHKRFVDGRLSVEDDAKPGRPCSVKTDVNIEKVRELVRELVHTDRRLTIRMMADQLGIDKELVRSILVDNLGMRKVCAKMVPRLLSEDQKTRRLHVCQDILQQLQTDATLLEKVITGDELWIFEYDPETKRQSCQWKSPDSPRPKKARMQKSQVKVMLIMLITFFDHQGMVHHEYAPHDQTVNQHFYKEVLTRLMAKIRRKRRELWAASNTWIPAPRQCPSTRSPQCQAVPGHQTGHHS